jgi:FtsZ-binding cell division protein ZapB
MTDKSVETQLALLGQDIRSMRTESQQSRAEMKVEMAALKADVSEIKQQAAKWKGVIAAILGLGGLMITFLTLWDKLAKAFRAG